MKTVRLLVLLVLAIVLPLRGAIAAAGGCALPMPAGVPERLAAAADGPPAHEGCPGHAMPSTADDATASSHPVAADPGRPGGCDHCAACAALPALPSGVPAPGLPEGPGAQDFPPFHAPAPAWACGVPDRPPRRG